MLASGYLNNYIHERFIIGASIVVLSFTFFVSYFIIDGSLNVFFFTFGTILGIGTGSYEGMLLQYYVLNQSLRHTALLAGIAIAGGPLGGVVIGQLATWFTNPENLTPNYNVQGIKVFTQDHIISKVPALLLILGGITLTLQLTGFLLLYHNKSHGQCGVFKSSRQGSYISSLLKENPREENDSNKDSGPNYEPNEVIKCLNFYKLVVVTFLIYFQRVVVFSYYKIYGQERIGDDHFLTNLGTGQALFNIPAALAWSALLDRLSLKSTCVCMLSGMALSSLLMYFTALWSKWAFLVAVLLATTTTQNYVCYGFGAVKLFGKKNASKNIALVELMALIGTVIPGMVLDLMIDKFGHFTEFACASICSCVALLIVALSYPD